MITKTTVKNILAYGFVLILVAGCGTSFNAIPVTGSDNSPVLEQAAPVVVDDTLQEQDPPSESNAAEPMQELEPAPMTESVQHVLIPKSAVGKPQVIHDQVSKDTAAQKQANGGDEFSRNRFERSFDQEMGYLPFLDIVEANLVRDEDFYYFMIRTVESVNQSPEPPVSGVELDLDLDGRGDFLLMARGPYTTEWAQAGVEVWEDMDDSVGSITPMLNDDPFGSGDGYETKVFEAGMGDNPDIAWVRLSPDDDTRVELALLSGLLPEGQIFLWGGFVDGLIKDPAALDLNDRFSLEEAGSAWKADKYYPLNMLYAVDSTCRAPSGYTSNGAEPGVCFIAQPPAPERGEPAPPVRVPQTPPGILR